jgi:uncharacterized membrane protein
MAEYFSLQAALCFATSHILIRRGLVTSNAVTGSFISLGMTALILWLLLPFFVPLSSLWTPAVWYFLVAGVFAPGLGRTLSVFHALSFGDVVVVEPLVSSNPVLSLILSAVFLKDLETVTPRVVLGALCTVLGTILVVTR